jgi:hypothetical protein
MNDIEKHLARMEELFQPIEQQILMTDDKNDLLLLSTIMLTTAKRIFEEQYGEQVGHILMNKILNQRST